MIKISLPARTDLHECLHYQPGISCTPAGFFNGSYQGLQMDSFPCISSRLPTVRPADRTRAHPRGSPGLSVSANTSLVGVLCRISGSKYEPVMLNACKEVCRRSPRWVRCVDSHVFECLHCSGSGCCSIVQTPARVQPSGPGSSAQMELCTAVATREEAPNCWAEVYL